MFEKIAALIFGLLALGLEVWLSIKNPTIESIVAGVFALVIVVTMIVLIIKDKKKVITISDTTPNGKRGIDKVMKLSNEIAPFVKEKDGKIYLTIIK